jgi:sulfite exporter TauE/SafE
MYIFLFTVIFVGLIIGYISTDTGKTQNVRLLDVFIIGPLMIYLGYLNYKNTKNNENLLKLLTIVLIFFGSSTITYNLKNYIKFNKTTK